MPRFVFAPMVAAATLAAAMPVLAQNAAPSLAPYAASFKGEQGLTVAVAPTADGKAALVRIQGINHPADNVVFLADKVTEGKRVSFRSSYDGRPWNMVVSEDFDSWGGSYSRTQAYLPAKRDGVQLYYDEKSAKALDLKALSKDYEKQKSESVQDKLARFDKPRFVATTEARLKSADDAASKACGVPVKTQVKWDSVTEEQMKRLSIGGYCVTAAEAMGRACAQDTGFKAKAAKHADITCQFGDKLNLSNQGGKTLFTTSEKAPNQDDFALQYLRNQ